MKAAKIMGLRNIACVEVDAPPRDGQHVLIRVTAAAICGSDKHCWELGNLCAGWVIGHEYEGIVKDAGCRDDLRPGDRVTSITMNPDMTCPYCAEGQHNLCAANDKNPGNSDVMGAVAELFSARADLVRKLPERIPPREGALIEPAAVCYHAVEKASVRQGHKVLICGAGIMAAFIAEFCRYLGAAQIVVVNRTLPRAEQLRQFGACDAAFSAEDPTLVQQLDAVCVDGFDVCFETTGMMGYVNQMMPYVKKGRDIILVGLNFGETTPVDVMSLIAREQRLVGVYYYTISDFDHVVRVLSAQGVCLGKYVSRIIPLDEIHSVFDSRSGDQFKTLVIP